MSLPTTYAIIDLNQRERFFLGDLIQQFEEQAEVLTFHSVAELLNSPFKEDPSRQFKGVFVAMDDNLDDIDKFIKVLRQKNMNTYFVACVPVIDLKIVQNLFDYGFNQVLVWPNEVPALKSIMKSAEAFQNERAEVAKGLSKSQSFRVWHETLAEKISLVLLAGSLTENFELPKLVPGGIDSVLLLDCENLKGFNSVGIRAWIQWMKQLKVSGFSQFIFKNVHSSFLRHVRSIDVMMPENGLIDSFYLLYFEEDLDIEKEFKFTHGKDFDANRMELPSFIESLHDGETRRFSLDDQIHGYLSFYKGKIEIVDRVIAK